MSNHLPTPDDITTVLPHVRSDHQRLERRRENDDEQESADEPDADAPTGGAVTSASRYDPTPRELAHEYMWEVDPIGMALAYPFEAAGRVADAVGEMVETGMNSVWGGESSDGDGGGSDGEDDGDADNDGVDDNKDSDGGLGSDTVEGGDLEQMPGLQQQSPGGVLDPAMAIDLEDAVSGPAPEAVVEPEIGTVDDFVLDS